LHFPYFFGSIFKNQKFKLLAGISKSNLPLVTRILSPILPSNKPDIIKFFVEEFKPSTFIFTN